MSNPAEDVEKDIEKAQREQQKLLMDKTALDKAELQEKRDAVFRERLNIINSSRGQMWSPQGNYNPIQQTNPKKDLTPLQQGGRAINDILAEGGSPIAKSIKDMLGKE